MLTPGTLITIFHPTNGCEVVATIANEEEKLYNGKPLYMVSWNMSKGTRRSVVTQDEIISIVEKVMVFQELGD